MRRKNPDTETVLVVLGALGVFGAILYMATNASASASSGASSGAGSSASSGAGSSANSVTPPPAGGTAGDGDVPNPYPDDAGSAFSTTGDGIGDD